MNNLNHVMLDIETFGVGNDAAVVSIGACMFNPYMEAVGRQSQNQRFYTVLDLNDPLIGVITPSTVAFWMKQGDGARLALVGDDVLRIGAKLACKEFAAFCKQQGAEYIWSNGPTFDETIMRSLFKRCGVKFPVHFRGSRCCRTIAGLARDMGFDSREALESVREGDVHNALDDAVHQCRWVGACARFLEGGAA